MYQWGVQSGPMLPRAQAVNAQSFQDATEYYTWQMGQDSWNMYTGIRGSNGQIVRFDAPLQSYGVSWA
jgi:hypothetical protein